MITLRENYLRMLRGEIPEFMPSFFEQSFSLGSLAGDAFTTPVYAPSGVAYSPWGVKFVGQAETNFGAIPEPNNFILHDITKWRDVIKNPDTSGIDWETHYKKVVEGKNRTEQLVAFGGGDYFQALVSFMGFTEALMAMYEEPEEVYALLEYISEYYTTVLKNQLLYGKPDIYLVADDCAAAAAPFFSVDMYQRLIKPFHKLHADLALNSGCMVEKHDCGRSESFIDDWIDIGITGWNPAQTGNDLKAIKKKYTGKMAIQGGWDPMQPACRIDAHDDELIAAVDEYVDLLAPDGGFLFFATIPGNPEDEAVKRKNKVLSDYFFSNVRDYYKTH